MRRTIRTLHPSAPREVEPAAAAMHIRCTALARTAQTGEANGGGVAARGKRRVGEVFFYGFELEQHDRNR